MFYFFFLPVSYLMYVSIPFNFDVVFGIVLVLLQCSSRVRFSFSCLVSCLLPISYLHSVSFPILFDVDFDIVLVILQFPSRFRFSFSFFDFIFAADF